MDTGIARRPPPHPPDRAALNNVVQSQTADNKVMHSGAENAADPSQNGEDLQNNLTPAVTAVTFVVANYANALCFIINLFKNMRAVDPQAQLKPQPGAGSNAVDFTDPTGNLLNETSEDLVNKYFEGLKVTQKGMIGKFWMTSKYSLSVFKKNAQFQEWLDGGQAGHRIQLDVSTLAGYERHEAGVFLNAVTRHNLTVNFQDMLLTQLQHSDLLEEQAIPNFQIEVKSMFRQWGETCKNIKAYWIVTATKDEASKMMEMVTKIYKHASATELLFVPTKLWQTLPVAKKNELLDMQYHFDITHDALKFWE
jgi:hypothetical protein